MPAQLSPADHKQLLAARQSLENPGLAIKLVNYVGSPIEILINNLPKGAGNLIGQATQGALQAATSAAIFTMKDSPGRKSSDKLHKLAVSASGGVGGLFGLGALAVELPISTTLMLRSILDIARSEGESLESVDTRLACLEVFALGGESKLDDKAEYGYFAVRTLLARTVTEAAEHLVGKSAAKGAAPGLVKLITIVAQRFSIQVTEKMAAQAVPLVGAVGGAAINALFIDHFQDVARGHFTIRRLERTYGEETVRAAYLKKDGGKSGRSKQLENNK